MEHALLIRQWSADIVFFTHTYPLTADERAALDARGVGVIDGLVARISVVDDRLDAVQLIDGRTFPRAAVFIRPAFHRHQDDPVDSLECELDESGFIRVDGTGRTSVAGVWAAGNVANPRAQVITAAGEGSAAAISINADLVQEDVECAVAQHLSPGTASDETERTPHGNHN